MAIICIDLLISCALKVNDDDDDDDDENVRCFVLSMCLRFPTGPNGKAASPNANTHRLRVTESTSEGFHQFSKKFNI